METFCIDTDASFLDSLDNESLGWSPLTIRLTLVTDVNEEPDICDCLNRIHNKKILPCKLVNRTNLQAETSG